MKDYTKQTELLQFTVNPSLLELMKVPGISMSPWFGFEMVRNGFKLHCTFYSGEDGLVVISQSVFHVLLRDHCQTPEDFARMLEKVDDLLTRMPRI